MKSSRYWAIADIWGGFAMGAERFDLRRSELPVPIIVKRLWIVLISQESQMQFRCPLFVSVTIGVLISATAFAAEKIVKGKIKSVDVAKKVITFADFQTRYEFQLDVSRKAMITIGRKAASLGDLKVGQNAYVKYDDELDVVSKIAVEEILDSVPSVTSDKAAERVLLENDSLDAWESPTRA